MNITRRQLRRIILNEIKLLNEATPAELAVNKVKDEATKKAFEAVIDMLRDEIEEAIGAEAAGGASTS